MFLIVFTSQETQHFDTIKRQLGWKINFLYRA